MYTLTKTTKFNPLGRLSPSRKDIAVLDSEHIFIQSNKHKKYDQQMFNISHILKFFFFTPKKVTDSMMLCY